MDGPADDPVRRQNRRHRHFRRQGQQHRGGAGRGRLWPGERVRRADAQRRPAGHRLFPGPGGALADPPLHHQHPRRRSGRSAGDGEGGPDPQPPDRREPALPRPHGHPVCRGPDAARRHCHQHQQPLRGLGGLLHHLRRLRRSLLPAGHVHHRGGHRPGPCAGPAGEVPGEGPLRRPHRPHRRGQPGLHLSRRQRVCPPGGVRPRHPGPDRPEAPHQPLQVPDPAGRITTACPWPSPTKRITTSKQKNPAALPQDFFLLIRWGRRGRWAGRDRRRRYRGRTGSRCPSPA